MRALSQATIERDAAAKAAFALAELGRMGVAVHRLRADSRTVEAGDVFLAYPGAAADGRRYIDQAITRGAAAVLWDPAGHVPQGDWRVPQLAIDGLRHVVGPLAQRVCGEPAARLWIAGVTGTNGKTSTSQWIAQALDAAGRRAAVIGTLGIGFVDALEPNPNTTPDPIVLAESLARLERAGAQAVSMEVSSIGLDQGRANGLAFDCAVFTNLSRDHLDYHGDMAAYGDAKARLFDVESLTHVVTNLDDPFGRALAARVDGRPDLVRIGYATAEVGADACDLRLVATGIEHRQGGLHFRITAGAVSCEVATRIVGRFNVSNLLAVTGVLVAAGFPLERIGTLLAGLAPVPGRMERLGGGGDRPSVIVDYAHTPDALEQVLRAARELAEAGQGRLTAVFGCGGDRDRGKRPQMGALAARLADRVVLTSDNPRSESPAAILAEIAAGVPGEADCMTIEDRAEAIAQAIASARAGDVVVLAGKGHEPYQEIAGERRPFSDVAHARRALEAATC